MVIPSDSCLASFDSLPVEILESILKIGLQENILDLPDIKVFKLVSRKFYSVTLKSNNNLWFTVLQKISNSLAQRFVEKRVDLIEGKQINGYAFELLKIDILKTVSRAKEANPLLRGLVEKEISINNITIEKIRELKRRILREGGYILREK
ncbi:MAG: hypothetical protein KR126chlam5_01193 [Candidatus Anoxychlamydiales bacterium]|nr:hypothetical protein [Candidatus Anoxychlamydiales bacterium]